MSHEAARARARRVRPRALLLGNLFRDQLDRYGELELVAERWRDAIGGLGFGAFQVQDDTGTIPVISQANPPRTGARIGADGSISHP